MLMYGNSAMAGIICSRIQDVVVYNLSSLSEIYPRINLIPPNNLGYNTDLEFDINYMNWIVYNDAPFKEFMRIISALNNGYNIYIVISTEDWSINLIESLNKYIQERYGITSVFIQTYDDYLNGNESEATEGIGLQNLQEDLARYAYIDYNNLERYSTDGETSNFNNPNNFYNNFNDQDIIPYQ